MKLNKKRIYALIEKYLNGTSNPDELEWIEKWLDLRSKQSEWSWRDKNHKEEVKNEIFERINDKASPFQPIKFSKDTWRYWRAAAALLVLGLAFSGWFLIKDKENRQVHAFNQSVTPGTKAATLQMGNGEIIYLDDKEEGVLSQTADIEISKRDGGIIQYHSSNKDLRGKVLENKLFIPRGGQYKIELSDGTKIWLNSETELVYPTRFVGNERKVKLIGEAYFEVAKDSNRPFIVESEKMDILVTGTEFNVSAYGGSSETTTTLIEGSVVVHGSGKENMKLVPGQQAYRRTDQTGFGKRQVDVDVIISWKRGYFSFDYQILEEVMDEVSRWYDIEYEIIGQPKTPEKLGGTFSRGKSLDELLTYLEQLVNVKTTREGRRVILMY